MGRVQTAAVFIQTASATSTVTLVSSNTDTAPAAHESDTCVVVVSIAQLWQQIILSEFKEICVVTLVAGNSIDHSLRGRPQTLSRRIGSSFRRLCADDASESRSLIRVFPLKGKPVVTKPCQRSSDRREPKIATTQHQSIRPVQYQLQSS